MAKRKTLALGLIVGSTLAMMVAFHNCAGGNLSSMAAGLNGSKGSSDGGLFPSVGSQPAGASAVGGGEGYDGMQAHAFASRTREGVTCPDGSDIQSQIEVDRENKSYLTRDNCESIAPRPIDSGLVEQMNGFDSQVVVYESRTYYNLSNAAEPKLDIFCYGYKVQMPQAKTSELSGRLANFSGLVPSVTSVRAMIGESGARALVTLSGRSEMTFNLSFNNNVYTGVTEAGDQMKLNMASSSKTIEFRLGGSQDLIQIPVTCEKAP